MEKTLNVHIVHKIKESKMKRKEHAEEWNKARVILAGLERKEVLTYENRSEIADNENSALQRNMFIDSAFKAGRISEAEFYQLGKQNTTNRLLKALILTFQELKVEDWLIDLED